MTCAYGQIPDFRVKTLCVNGKIFIDKDRNVTAKQIKSRSLVVNGNSKFIDVTVNGNTVLNDVIVTGNITMNNAFFTGDVTMNDKLTVNDLCITGSVDGDVTMNDKLTVDELCVVGDFNVEGSACYSEIATNKITSKEHDDGCVIETPMFLSRYGIGRVFLSEKYYFEDNDFAILDEDDWEISHEGYPFPGGDSLFKQNGNLFTLPTEFPNECLGSDWCAFVEVDVTLRLLMVDFTYAFDYSDTETVNLMLFKNGDGDEDLISISSMSNNVDGEPQFKTIHLKDTVKCFPGDSLNIGIYHATDDGETLINEFPEFDPHVANYANFKIIGFERLLD